MAECNDKRCPVHGSLAVRGTVLTGTVVSAKPGKTAIVERTIVRYVPKYERYKKSRSRIYAHSPECIGAKEGDIVRVAETRKLSKTKSFVVLEIVGKKKTIKVEEDTLREHKREKEEEEKPKEETDEAEKEKVDEMHGKTPEEKEKREGIEEAEKEKSEEEGKGKKEEAEAREEAGETEPKEAKKREEKEGKEHEKPEEKEDAEEAEKESKKPEGKEEEVEKK